MQVFYIPLFEHRMLEFMITVQILDFVEVVHVQLTYETGVVLGFEVFGQDFYEALLVLDDERISVRRPFDQSSVVFLLDHLVRRKKEIGLSRGFGFLGLLGHLYYYLTWIGLRELALQEWRSRVLRGFGWV